MNVKSDYKTVVYRQVNNQSTMAAPKPNKFMRRIVDNIHEAAMEPGFTVAFVNPDQYDRFYVRYVVPGGFYSGITIVFELAIKEFPMKAPGVKVLTPTMWHPNISPAGSICVDFIYDESKWSKEYAITTVFTAIQCLLQDGNCDGGHYNPEASACLRDCFKNGKDFAPFEAAVKVKTGKYSHEYDRYFRKDSEHLVHPRLAEVVKESTQEEKKVKVSAMASKFAKLNMKKIKSTKLKVTKHDDDDDDDEDGDTHENEAHTPVPPDSTAVKESISSKSAQIKRAAVKRKEETRQAEARGKKMHSPKKSAESSDEDDKPANQSDESESESEDDNPKQKVVAKKKVVTKTKDKTKTKTKAKAGRSKAKKEESSDEDSSSSEDDQAKPKPKPKSKSEGKGKSASKSKGKGKAQKESESDSDSDSSD